MVDRKGLQLQYGSRETFFGEISEKDLEEFLEEEGERVYPTSVAEIDLGELRFSPETTPDELAHEIGHFASGHLKETTTSRKSLREMVREEVEATVWAYRKTGRSSVMNLLLRIAPEAKTFYKTTPREIAVVIDEEVTRLLGKQPGLRRLLVRTMEEIWERV